MKVCDLLEKEIKFGKAQLILVGGRPAMGKTSFARSTSVVLAEKGYKIGYFSLELNRNEWLGRASNIKSAEEIVKLPIDILDEVPRSAEEIEADSVEKNYDLLIIDYLQLVDRGDGSLNDVIRSVRNLADKLSIPVIVLSQLTRNIEMRDNHMPKIEDLKAGGIEEKLFDQVFLLYRGHYYNREEDPTKLIVVKKTGEEQLEWDYESLSVL